MVIITGFQLILFPLVLAALLENYQPIMDTSTVPMDMARFDTVYLPQQHCCLNLYQQHQEFPSTPILVLASLGILDVTTADPGLWCPFNFRTCYPRSFLLGCICSYVNQACIVPLNNLNLQTNQSKWIFLQCLQHLLLIFLIEDNLSRLILTISRSINEISLYKINQVRRFALQFDRVMLSFREPKLGCNFFEKTLAEKNVGVSSLLASRRKSVFLFCCCCFENEHLLKKNCSIS